MKLLAPISIPSEVDDLISAGAEELFCGLVPDSWSSSQRHDWLNRRHPKNGGLRRLEELELLIGRAAARNVPVFVAMNGRAFHPSQIPSLVEMAGGFAAAGARAVIVADVSLVIGIREAGVPIDIHLSSVASCLNSEAAAFFGDLGVKRIILPRYLSTREIAVLCGKGANIEYEAFYLNDGCTYEEGLCLTSHAPGPFCCTPWRTEIRPGPTAPADLDERWRETWRSYERLIRILDNCGQSMSSKGLPNGPCGLCALPMLQAAGVHALKVCGREAETSRRIASVKLAKTVLDWVRQGDLAGVVAARARALRDTPELCDCTYMCYYR